MGCERPRPGLMLALGHQGLGQPAPVQRTEAATTPPHPPQALTPHHKKSNPQDVYGGGAEDVFDSHS